LHGNRKSSKTINFALWKGDFWKPFSLDEINKINEALRSGIDIVEFEATTLMISEKLLFYNENPENFTPVKSIEKFTEIHLNSSHISLKQQVIQDIDKGFNKAFIEKFNEFFYGSLLGLLRASEIIKKPLYLENIISKRRIFSCADLPFYKQMTQDEEFEKSSVYQQFLISLQEMSMMLMKICSNHLPMQGF